MGLAFKNVYSVSHAKKGLNQFISLVLIVSTLSVISVAKAPEATAAASTGGVSSYVISSGGGNEVSDNCSTGSVVDAVYANIVRFANYDTMSYVGIGCRTLTASGLLKTNPGGDRGWYGSDRNVNDQRQVRCESSYDGDAVVIGVRLFKSPAGYPSGIKLICSTLPDSKSTNQFEVSAVMGRVYGMFAYEDLKCPVGTVAIGLRVASGSILDRFGFNCGPVTGATQAITFNSLTNRTFGGSFSLSAISSSGLGVSFASGSTNVCNVSGTTVTFVNTGSCTINANQSGNTNWAAASQVQHSFTVTSAAALNPTFGTPTATPFGFTVEITNYSASYTWSDLTVSAGSVSAGTASNSNQLLTVTGLAPGQSATIRQGTSRTGHNNGAATVTGTTSPLSTCSPISSSSGGYTTVTFTSPTRCLWVVPTGVTQSDVLVVGGGGGGGGDAGNGGGGGGIYEGTINLGNQTGRNFVIAVGAGGLRGVHTARNERFSTDSTNLGGSSGGFSSIVATDSQNQTLTIQANGGAVGAAAAISPTAGGTVVVTNNSVFTLTPTENSTGGAGGAGFGLSGGGSGSPGAVGYNDSTLFPGSFGGGGGGGAAFQSGQTTSGGAGSNGGGTGASGEGQNPSSFSTAGAPNSGGGGGGGGAFSPDALVTIGGIDDYSKNGAPGGSGVVIIRYIDAPVVTVSSSTIDATVATAVTNFVTSSGGSATFSISPTLPSGLTFNTSTASITGTPTTASASASYTINATNSSGSTSATFTLSVATLISCEKSETSSGGFMIVSITTVQSCGWSTPTGVTTADVLVVGGGGGGAGNFPSTNPTTGGSGGGGGVYEASSVPISGTIRITVGAGGAGGTSYNTDNRTGRAGAQGATSAFGTITAGGGGGGGCETAGINDSSPCASGTTIYGRGGTAAGSGGSSGYYLNAFNYGNPGLASSAVMGGTTFAAVPGFAGGTFDGPNTKTGSGGGAGGAANLNTPGLGVSSSITGTATVYGKGGSSNGATGWSMSALAANTGTGGSGASNGGGTALDGVSGSSGIVVIKYALPALTPTFGTKRPTVDGFTVQISNFNSAYTWSGTATETGTVSIHPTNGLVTVTGIAAGTSSTATITSTVGSSTTASATVTETSLTSIQSYLRLSYNSSTISSYDAAVGTTVTDLSGSAINGTVGPGITLDSTGAWVFAGEPVITRYVDVNDITSTQFAVNGITVDFEADFGTVSSNEGVLNFRVGTGSPNSDLIIYRDRSTNELRIEIFNGSSVVGICSLDAITSGLSRYTVTLDGTYCKVYRDSNPVLAQSFPYKPTTGVIWTNNRIGSLTYPNTTNLFYGSIRSIRIYEGAYTPTQIGEPGTYKVITYTGNGGTPGISSFTTSGTVKLTSATRAGYTFDGWFTDITGGSKIGNASAIYTPTGDITLHAQWSPNSLVVSYDEQGGTTIADGVVNVGASISSAPAIPTKDGYSLSGWSTTSTGSVITFPYAHGLTAGFTLYAIWAATPYTVTYATTNYTGGTAPTDSASYTIGNNVIIKADTGSLARTGYSLAGWTAASDGSGTVLTSGSTFTTSTSNMTFYPKWSTSTYTVTYNKNGASGSPAVLTASYTTGADPVTLTTVGTMVKTGFNFGGWSELPTGSALTGTYLTSVNVTLYAVWTIKSIGITFAKGTASAEAFTNFPTSRSSNYGTTITLNDAVDIAKSISGVNHAFVGWSDGASIYQSGASYLLGETAPTFTAIWVKIFAVRYTFNGGTAAAGSSDVDAECALAGNTCTDGQVITANPAPTRDGYTFAGWVDQFSEEVVAGQSFTVRDNRYLIYANWTPIDYLISYNTAGGSPAGTSFTKQRGQSFEIAAAPTKTGYRFDGWSYGATIFGAGVTFYVATSPIELTAQWTPDIYKVVYDWNGGTGSTTINGSFTVGSNAMSLPTVGNHVKAGFSFAGWSTSANGAVISGGYTPTADSILYAIWSIATPVVDNGGGSNLGGGSSTTPTPVGPAVPPTPVGPAVPPTLVKSNITIAPSISIVGDTETKISTVDVTVSAVESQIKPPVLTLDDKTKEFIAEVKVIDGKLGLTPQIGFSGKRIVTVTITENGVERFVQIPLIVLPEPVAKPILTPIAVRKSIIRWKPSDNADSYTVLLDSRRVCSTSTYSCSVSKLLGPNSKVEVISNGADGTISERAMADFNQVSAVTVIRIVSATITKATLTAVDTKALDKIVALIKNQGFSTVQISEIITTRKTKALADARIGVIKQYLNAQIGNFEVKFEVTPAKSKTYFNYISVFAPVKSNITIVKPVTVVSNQGIRTGIIEIAPSALGANALPPTLKVDAASEQFVTNLKILDSNLVLTVTPSFSGIRTVSVTITESGVDRIIQIPLTVLPEAVTNPVVTPVTATRTVVRWIASPSATSYTVYSGTKKLCSTAATSCTIKSILGPRSVITVASSGGDRTLSKKVQAQFKAGTAIRVVRISSARISNSALTAVDVKALGKVITLIKKQGFRKVQISEIITTGKTKALADSRIAVIKRYISSKIGTIKIKYEITPAKSKTYFNNISVKG